MTDARKPLNQSTGSAHEPRYAEPVLGNPVSTLMESGVGNCFPGLEFDLRQLDVRFFPGLVFEFPGITPAGPDGTQGAQLIYADTAEDPIFDLKLDWVAALKRQLNGPEGGALGDGKWYLHWVQQYEKRIELYDFTLYQNALVPTPYEGETCWWIIRLIEADPDPDTADLSIALTRRDETGAPTGMPVVLHGKRRSYLDGEGMISDVYHPGELTASMCSPWTHDFRDCACHYWASNHPDVALGPVEGPELENRTSADDPVQAVSFLDWMRRRHDPSRDVSAATTIEAARADRYDPYEINLHWEQLSFVLQGEEVETTPERWQPPGLHEYYKDSQAAIDDLTNNLAPLEFTLSMRYLYAYFSLRDPGDVTADQRQQWPQLADDLRAARQLLLSVALSEMTHMRWANQILWLLDQGGNYPNGQYAPVVRPSDDAMATPQDALRPATPEVLAEFVEVERPSGALDAEYAGLVDLLRKGGDVYPTGLFELAVRIDSDGLQHYQKFRDILVILTPYRAQPALYLRDIALADPDDPAVQPALDLLDQIVAGIKSGYDAEANGEMPAASEKIQLARDHMHALSEIAEALARGETGAGGALGIPFFARWQV